MLSWYKRTNSRNERKYCSSAYELCEQCYSKTDFNDIGCTFIGELHKLVNAFQVRVSQCDGRLFCQFSCVKSQRFMVDGGRKNRSHTDSGLIFYVDIP